MPIYEYECDSCGHRLEKLQKISDDPLKDCPSCGESDLRKLISRAGFRLKGTGWYVTDFKDKPKPKTDGKPGDDKPKDKTAKADDGKSASGTTDSKPSTASDTPTTPKSDD